MIETPVEVDEQKDPIDVLPVEVESQTDFANVTTEVLHATLADGLVHVNQEKFNNEQEFLPA